MHEAGQIGEFTDDGRKREAHGAWLGLFGLAEGHRRLAEIDGALECIDEARGKFLHQRIGSTRHPV